MRCNSIICGDVIAIKIRVFQRILNWLSINPDHVRTQLYSSVVLSFKKACSKCSSLTETEMAYIEFLAVV